MYKQESPTFPQDCLWVTFQVINKMISYFILELEFTKLHTGKLLRWVSTPLLFYCAFKSTVWWIQADLWRWPIIPTGFNGLYHSLYFSTFLWPPLPKPTLWPIVWVTAARFHSVHVYAKTLHSSCDNLWRLWKPKRMPFVLKCPLGFGER